MQVGVAGQNRGEDIAHRLACEESLTGRYLRERPKTPARRHLARFRREQGWDTLAEEVGGLAKISILKGVGGILRPGFAMALPEAELVKIPGWSKDIEKSRAEARALLKAAGVENLTLKLLNRNVAEPYTPAGVFVVDQFKRVGVNAQHEQLETKLYFDGVGSGNFDVAVEFINDPNDDPTQQFAKYLTKKASAIGYSGHEDVKLDQLYDRQRRAINPVERTKIVNELERYALTTAYNVPLLWYHRIIVNHKKIKGWHFTPSHYVQQDLVEVWLDQ